MLLVLPRIDQRRFSQQFLNLLLQPLPLAVLRERRVARHTVPVQRYSPQLHHSRVAAQLQHVHEHPEKRIQVSRAEAVDRPKVGAVVRRQVPKCDVHLEHRVDPPRARHPVHVRVQHHLQHHHRVKRRCTPAIHPVRSVECVQPAARIHSIDDLGKEARQAVVLHPLLDRGGHQEQLVLIVIPEVVAHRQLAVARVTDVNLGCRIGSCDPLQGFIGQAQ